MIAIPDNTHTHLPLLLHIGTSYYKQRADLASALCALQLSIINYVHLVFYFSTSSMLFGWWIAVGNVL